MLTDLKLYKEMKIKAFKVNMVTMKRFLSIIILVELVSLLFTSPFSMAVSHEITPKEGKDTLTTHSELKNTYRQNENLTVTASFFNNRTQGTDNITSLWLLLTRKLEQRTPAPEKKASKNFSYIVSPNHSQTVHIEVSLRDVPPATYNVTSYFEDSEGSKYYLMEGKEVKVRSSLNIPPIAYALVGIMIAVILVFVGYYFSGKVGS